MLALLVITIVIYWGGLKGPFLFDDYPNFIDNDHFRNGGFDYESLKLAVSKQSSRPVSMTSLYLNYKLLGSSEFSFKVINLVLHLMTGILCFLFVRALLGLFEISKPEQVALLTATIFLLHPLQVSTVLYVVQRMAILAALFSLFFLFSICRYIEIINNPNNNRTLGMFWVAAATVSIFLAYFSKQNSVVVIPLTCILFLVFIKQETRIQKWHRALSWLLVVLGFLSFFYLIFINTNFFYYGHRDFTLNERLMTESRVLIDYLFLIFIPVPKFMPFFWDNYEISRGFLEPITTLYSVFTILIVFLFGGWLAVRKRNIYGVAILFFFVAHSVESSVVPLEIAFEHRNYLPLVGPAILISVFVNSIARNIRRILIAVITLGLMVGAWQRVGYFESKETLFSKTLENGHETPGSLKAYAFSLLEKSGSAEEVRTNANLAYQFLKKSHELSGLDISSTVVILQLLQKDQSGEFERYFSELEARVDEAGVSSEMTNSISRLTACYIRHGCTKSADRVENLLEALLEKGISLSNQSIILMYLGALQVRVLNKTEQGLENSERAYTINFDGNALSNHIINLIKVEKLDEAAGLWHRFYRNKEFILDRHYEKIKEILTRKEKI